MKNETQKKQNKKSDEKSEHSLTERVVSVSGERVKRELAGRDFSKFALYVDENLEFTQFHRALYAVLDAFAQGKITRLMISIPPQHGKSHAASRLLPAYLLGLNPDLRIAIGSYSFALARKFGMGVRGVLASKAYSEIFPETFLKGSNGSSKNDLAMLTAEEFDCIGHKGGMKMVGRECSLTGNRVDVMILDDLYKDAMEANSPLVRENTWDWYTSVVRTRMHNLSREIIVFTRWHEDDLIGRISHCEKLIDIQDLKDLNEVPNRTWVRINFEALKNSPPTPLDPRATGEALWEERHSAELLKERQKIDPAVFEALYQGQPRSQEGLLYAKFATYETLPLNVSTVANYTDTADTGTDYLCSICYVTDPEGFVYITEVVYTDAPMEETETLVAQMLIIQKTEQALFESNNGGRGFARSVQRLLEKQKAKTIIKTHHQKNSKEARILTNATAINNRVKMPQDWREKWAKFAADLTNFKRTFKANPHDDAPDALTGLIEQLADNEQRVKKIKSMRFSNR